MFHKFAALALTVVMSATCVLSAVGPASATASATGKSAVAHTVRFMA